MRIQPLLIALTGINLAVLAVGLVRAQPQTAPVLRGRALEIVDARGRVRASITLAAANPTYRMPDGTVGYPETVLLRLIDPHGKPNVKIQATEDGALVGLGPKEPTYVQLGAQGAKARLKLTNVDGTARVVEP